MAFVPTPLGAMLTALFRSSDNTFAQNRFWFACPAGVDEAALLAIAEAYNTWNAEEGKSLYTANWSLVDITVRDMTEEEGIQITDTEGLPSVGTNAGSAGPFQVTWTTTWRTGLVGRSNRGRTFGIGMSQEAALHNVLTSAAHSLFVTKMQSFLDIWPTVDPTVIFSIASFSNGGIPREEGVLRPVTEFSVPFPLATQRRRLR